MAGERLHPLGFEQLETFSAIRSGLRALVKARIRCLSGDEVLSRLEANPLVLRGERALLFMKLHEIELTAHQLNRLRCLLTRLEADDDAARSRSGQRITGLIREILKLLPADERVQRCLPHLVHRTSHRRSMACGILRYQELAESDVTAVCFAAKEQGDLLLLQLVARKAGMARVDHLLDSILPRLEEPYWQSRVVEAILDRASNDILADVAATYPIAYLWAIARRGAEHRLSVVLPHLRELPWRWLPIAAWALGRLGAGSELDALESRLRQSSEWAQFIELVTDRDRYLSTWGDQLWPPWHVVLADGSRHAVDGGGLAQL